MEFSRCARSSRPHLLRSPLRRYHVSKTTWRRLTDLSKLNSALAAAFTEVKDVCVGDEVDMNLGELWHRTTSEPKFAGHRQAQRLSGQSPDSLERR